MTTTTVIKWDGGSIRKAHSLVRAIDHKLRQRIMDLLSIYGELTVTEIYCKLRLDQSVASQHLGILRKEGVIVTERRGKYIYYSVDYDIVAKAQEAIGNFSKL